MNSRASLIRPGRHGAVFGFAGWSGSGKTTLVEKVIAYLSANGIEIATIKHAHHHFDADHEGKDSFRHREAGSRQVLVSSAHRSAHLWAQWSARQLAPPWARALAAL